ncbi:Werner syndrome-like exonuclease, partial [Thalictrum thalictroides]
MAGNSSNNLTTKYNVNFAGKIIETTVTKMASAAENWVREIRSIHNGRRIILGLDCEWRCTDYWGFFNKVATLQLCVDNNCLILQMVFMDYLPQALKDFLNDHTVTCVGVQ